MQDSYFNYLDPAIPPFFATDLGCDGFQDEDPIPQLFMDQELSNNPSPIFDHSSLMSDQTTPASTNPSDTPSLVSIAFSPHQLCRLNSPPSPIELLALPPAMNDPLNLSPSACGKYLSASPHQRRLYKQANPQRSESFSGVMKMPTGRGAKAQSPTLASSESSGSPTSTGRKPGKKPQSGNVVRRFCHICRSAKELNKIVNCCSGKQSHVFCSSCVGRRLGLVFEDLVVSDNWLCPKCELRCPCSKCRKGSDGARLTKAEAL